MEEKRQNTREERRDNRRVAFSGGRQESSKEAGKRIEEKREER